MSWSIAAARSRSRSRSPKACTACRSSKSCDANLRHLPRVRLVEVVVPPEARARVEHALGLAGGVPHVEELVDQLLEDARGEPHARREDGRQVELLGEAQEDGRRRHDGVRAVGPELVLVAPLAVRHGAELLEERLRAPATSMARPLAGQRSNSVSTLPPVPTSTSTLPTAGSASPSARSMASSRSFSRLRSTVFTPLRYASSIRTVPSGSDIVKAVLPWSSSVSSVEPPPTSTSRARSSPIGHAAA